MAKTLVPDDLWTVIAQLLSPARAAVGGRTAAHPGWRRAHRHPVRAAHLPAMGVPAPRVGLRPGHVVLALVARLAGSRVRAALHRVLLEQLEGAGQLDWRRAALDSASVAAERGAQRPARTPTAREQAGLEAPLPRRC